MDLTTGDMSQAKMGIMRHYDELKTKWQLTIDLPRTYGSCLVLTYNFSICTDLCASVGISLGSH